MLCILGMHSTDYLQQDACYCVYHMHCMWHVHNCNTYSNRVAVEQIYCKRRGCFANGYSLNQVSKIWRIIYISHTKPNSIYTISNITYKVYIHTENMLRITLHILFILGPLTQMHKYNGEKMADMSSAYFFAFIVPARQLHAEHDRMHGVLPYRQTIGNTDKFIP